MLRILRGELKAMNHKLHAGAVVQPVGLLLPDAKQQSEDNEDCRGVGVREAARAGWSCVLVWGGSGEREINFDTLL